MVPRSALSPPSPRSLRWWRFALLSDLNIDQHSHIPLPPWMFFVKLSALFIGIRTLCLLIVGGLYSGTALRKNDNEGHSVY